MTRMTFRHMCSAVAAACFMTISAGAAVAQDYPKQPISFVVPMAPGGGVDTVSRSVAQLLSERIGQTVIVENKPGAGGLVAAGYVVRAAPDGYTVFVADTGQLSVTPSLHETLPYDKTASFVPITEAVSAPLFLAVNAASPIKSVEDFIAYAKANPGTVYGSTGVGGVHHLGMHLLATKAGVELVHVPYRGSSQSTTALASGEVPVLLSALPSLRGHIESGKVRVIAVATPERSVLMPDLPTIAETGGNLSDFSVAVNIGFVLPPETPDAIAQYLYKEIDAVMDDKALQDRLMSMGLVPLRNGPDQYRKNIAADTAKYLEVIKASGATAQN
ncbi:hypothetical protein CKA81_00075 [Pollutimonas thiosulfatoxidans]|uniref:ABC transporter substrate-binding protein n=2 Tax=Pollutimonas thiosulfatoxidans TaxID=2028345 RepID=A0A410G811_9BURK|nr:hypothetical protein CKA81_00075 [Pollutimonas thiosulfatoxidans]